MLAVALAALAWPAGFRLDAHASANPLEIQAIWESPATEEGAVTLTIVTGTAADAVWVHFDGTGIARASRVSTNLTSATWTATYAPGHPLPHQVTVFSARRGMENRAESRVHTVVMHSPHVPLEHPAIQSITVSVRDIVHANPRQAAPGYEVTVRVRTNADMEAVWLRDMDGIERRAARVWPETGAMRNWEVVFTPTRSGSVVVFANLTHSHIGAAQRSERITIGQSEAAEIFSAAASPIWGWESGAAVNLNLSVTTSERANSVWAHLPGGQTVELRQVAGFNATSDRVWEASVWAQRLPIVVHASEAFGQTEGFSDSAATIWHVSP